MLRSEAGCEASVRPRRIEMEVHVSAAAVVPDPSIALHVDVRHFRMAIPVRGDAVFLAGRRRLLSAWRGRRRWRGSRSSSCGSGSRTARWNVSAANFRGASAAGFATARLAAPLLGKRRRANK